MTEPTFRKDQPVFLPSEPVLSSPKASADNQTGKPIIPAEDAKGETLDEKNRQVLMSLSKDLEEISRPYQPPEEAKEPEAPQTPKEEEKDGFDFEPLEVPRAKDLPPLKPEEKIEPTLNIKKEEPAPAPVQEPKAEAPSVQAAPAPAAVAVPEPAPAPSSEPPAPPAPPEMPPSRDPAPMQPRPIIIKDELGDPEEISTGGGFMRFIMLLICLLLVIAATWQVCLFLQPEFMRQSPVKEFSQQSCALFYCPPMREPRILRSELQATGPDEWEVKLQVQNQDMRAQDLPQFVVTLLQKNAPLMKAVFDSKDYKTTPPAKELRGGETLAVTIPFKFSGGRPSQFLVKVLPTNFE